MSTRLRENTLRTVETARRLSEDTRESSQYVRDVADHIIDLYKRVNGKDTETRIRRAIERATRYFETPESARANGSLVTAHQVTLGSERAREILRHAQRVARGTLTYEDAHASLRRHAATRRNKHLEARRTAHTKKSPQFTGFARITPATHS